jgi:hypothetical protein
MSTFVVCSAAAAAGFAVAFEGGRICEHRIFGLSKVGISTREWSTQNNIISTSIFLVLLITELFLLPKLWNPFSYLHITSTDVNSTDNFSSVVAFAVLGSWSCILAIGYGAIFTWHQALRKERGEFELAKVDHECNRVATEKRLKEDVLRVSKDMRFAVATAAAAAGRCKQLDSVVGQHSTALPENERVWSKTLFQELDKKAINVADNAIDKRWREIEDRDVHLMEMKRRNIEKEKQIKEQRARRTEQATAERNELETEKAKLKKLTEELEFLKVGMAEFKKENMKKEQEKVDEWSKKMTSLSDREMDLKKQQEELEQSHKQRLELLNEKESTFVKKQKEELDLRQQSEATNEKNDEYYNYLLEKERETLKRMSQELKSAKVEVAALKDEMEMREREKIEELNKREISVKEREEEMRERERIEELNKQETARKEREEDMRERERIEELNKREIALKEREEEMRERERIEELNKKEIALKEREEEELREQMRLGELNKREIALKEREDEIKLATTRDTDSMTNSQSKDVQSPSSSESIAEEPEKYSLCADHNEKLVNEIWHISEEEGGHDDENDVHVSSTTSYSDTETNDLSTIMEGTTDESEQEEDNDEGGTPKRKEGEEELISICASEDQDIMTPAADEENTVQSATEENQQESSTDTSLEGEEIEFEEKTDELPQVFVEQQEQQQEEGSSLTSEDDELPPSPEALTGEVEKGPQFLDEEREYHQKESSSDTSLWELSCSSFDMVKDKSTISIDENTDCETINSQQVTDMEMAQQLIINMSLQEEEGAFFHQEMKDVEKLNIDEIFKQEDHDEKKKKKEDEVESKTTSNVEAHGVEEILSVVADAITTEEEAPAITSDDQPFDCENEDPQYSNIEEAILSSLSQFRQELVKKKPRYEENDDCHPQNPTTTTLVAAAAAAAAATTYESRGRTSIMDCISNSSSIDESFFQDTLFDDASTFSNNTNDESFKDALPDIDTDVVEEEEIEIDVDEYMDQENESIFSNENESIFSNNSNNNIAAVVPKPGKESKDNNSKELVVSEESGVEVIAWNEPGLF